MHLSKCKTTAARHLLITAPLDARLQDIFNISSLGELKPSQFIARSRALISQQEMSDSVLCELLLAKLPYEIQVALATTVGTRKATKRVCFSCRCCNLSFASILSGQFCDEAILFHPAWQCRIK